MYILCHESVKFNIIKIKHPYFIFKHTRILLNVHNILMGTNSCNSYNRMWHLSHIYTYNMFPFGHSPKCTHR